MGEQWHYARAGKQSGPVSAAELKQLASIGHLSPTDMVWKEGMSNWVPAEKLKGLFTATPAATAPPPLPPSPLLLSESAPQTMLAGGGGKFKTSLWTYLLFAGAGLMFVAFLTPWWSFKDHRSGERGQPTSKEKKRKEFSKEEDERLERSKDEMEKKHGQWLVDHFGQSIILTGWHEGTLWGWNTGPGLMGFVFCIIIACLIVPPLFLPILARWAWIGAFVSALLGFLEFLLSMIWFFPAPGGISQVVIIGPWVSMIGGLLVVVAGILDGLPGLKAFNATVKTRTS